MDKYKPKCSICLAFILIILIIVSVLLSLFSNINIPLLNNQLNLGTIVLLIIAFGGFGGILQSLRDLSSDAATSKESFNFDYLCKNAFFVLTSFSSGVGGAIATNFLFIWLSKIEYVNDPKNIIYLIGLNTIGGFLGYKALIGIANKVEREIQNLREENVKTEKKIDEKSQLNTALDNALISLNTKIFTDIKEAKDQLLIFKDRYPLHRKLTILLGRLYKNLEQYNEAIDVLSIFLNNKKQAGQIDLDYAAATYNKACYNALLAKIQTVRDKSDLYKKLAIADLKEAISINADHKKDAAADSDFDFIRDDAEFIQITK